MNIARRTQSGVRVGEELRPPLEFMYDNASTVRHDSARGFESRREYISSGQLDFDMGFYHFWKILQESEIAAAQKGKGYELVLLFSPRTEDVMGSLLEQTRKDPVSCGRQVG